MGSIRLYVIHSVSLWNGTKSSPFVVDDDFKASHGQTSPREIPPSVVRVAGQIGESPSIRAAQRGFILTRSVGPSLIDVFARKSNGKC